MSPVETKLPSIFLQPGEMVLAKEPTIIITILGSCVGVAMFNARFRVAALCHGSLPTCEDEVECASQCENCFKYVGCSIIRMLERFAELGIKQNEIEVKLFGGASIIERREGYGNNSSVGEQNVEIAEQIIKSKGLNLIASDVGGMLGRKIYFDTSNGEVLLKRIKKSELSNL